jgi:anaerobic selenocysteine-containing dehydrogenase
MPKQVAIGLPVRHHAVSSRCPTSTAPTTCSCSAPTPTRRTAACAPPRLPRPARGHPGPRRAVVVVDPRRSRTAESADEWVAIRPGTDALLLAAMVPRLFERGWPTGDHVAAHLNGSTSSAGGGARSPRRPWPPVRHRRRHHPPPRPRAGRRAHRCGLRAHRHLHPGVRHHHLVAGRRAQRVTGNLDRPGGAMFPGRPRGGQHPGPPGGGRASASGGATPGARPARGDGASYPVAALAEEIDTPGEGPDPGDVTVAGNPVLSTPQRPPRRRARRRSTS